MSTTASFYKILLFICTTKKKAAERACKHHQCVVKDQFAASNFVLTKIHGITNCLADEKRTWSNQVLKNINITPVPLYNGSYVLPYVRVDYHNISSRLIIRLLNKLLKLFKAILEAIQGSSTNLFWCLLH